MYQQPLFAKQISRWARADLHKLNIVVKPVSRTTFFRGAYFPPSRGQSFESFLSDPPVSDPNSNAKDITSDLFHPIRFALMPTVGRENAVNHLAKIILERLGYTARDRKLHVRKRYPFVWCEKQHHMKPSMTVTDAEGCITLLLANKCHGSPKTTGVRAIAAALAAFVYNNQLREACGLQTLESFIFPALTMVGDGPTFYWIPVSSKLIAALEEDKFPEEQTTVLAYSTGPPKRHGELPSSERLGLELSGDSQERLELLTLLHSFKKFMNPKYAQLTGAPGAGRASKAPSQVREAGSQEKVESMRWKGVRERVGEMW